MTPEQINIAIAESIGWRHREGGMWYCPDGSTVPEDQIPNYTADLNAMHEVVRSIIIKSNQLAECYAENLSLVATGDYLDCPNYLEIAHICNATAVQRRSLSPHNRKME